MHGYLDYTECMLTAVLDTHLNTFHLDINFSAGKGKTTVLLGESGAGKAQSYASWRVYSIQSVGIFLFKEIPILIVNDTLLFRLKNVPLATSFRTTCSFHI